jgi:hypothetical protein
MSAEKSHPSHRHGLNAAVTSAVVRAGVRRGGGRSPDAPLGVGAAPGCRAGGPSDAGAEAQGG